MNTIDKLRQYIKKLESENEDRSIELQNKVLTPDRHKILVHEYNLTLKVIKELINILLDK